MQWLRESAAAGPLVAADSQGRLSAPAAANHLVRVWRNGSHTGGTGGLSLAHSDDLDKTWSEPMVVHYTDDRSAACRPNPHQFGVPCIRGTYLDPADPPRH
jgi:hypothetical protein